MPTQLTLTAAHSQLLVEEWRDIPKFEGFYQASTLGRIRSLDRVLESFSRKGNKYRRLFPGTVLACAPNNWGHMHVMLSCHGKAIGRLVHRLVLETFVGPCPPGMECRHFPDDDKRNNRLDNLQWGTPKENAQDKIIHGTTGKGKSVSKEMRERISKKLTGSKHSAESRAKMSAAHQRRANDPEVSRMLSEAQLKRWAKIREECGGVLTRATLKKRKELQLAAKQE